MRLRSQGRLPATCQQYVKSDVRGARGLLLAVSYRRLWRKELKLLLV